MSQENVEVARKPLRVRERSSRTLDQRLFLRFPRLADAYVRLILRLPPTSRLRQAAVWRAIQLSLEAWNRRDLDATELGRLPDYEFHPARELIEVGLVEPCYRGPGGSREYMSGFSEAWRADARVEPVELIDLGDRLVLLADVPASGRASGVPLTQKFASVITLKHGQAIRQQDYFDHSEALHAARLRD